MTTSPRFAEILVEGPDSQSFLHGQLASDIRAIEPGQWRFGSYCAADGRVQALLMVARESTERWRLLLPADLMDPVSQRLQRYKLRARCSVAGAVVGITAAPGLSAPGASSYACAAFNWHVIAGVDEPLPHALWTQQLLLGIPWIVSATSERFLPQMLALERMQAFSLRKGCFPGQEIVARTHYLGRSKRRLVRVAWSGEQIEAAPGAELSGVDGDSVVGMLVACDSSTGLAVVSEIAQTNQYLRVTGTARNATFVIESDVIETIGDGELNGPFHPPFSA